MSISITCKNVLKKYGDNVIIPNLNLKVKNGEFFTLLGPSGCGKTTLLRMVAGFNSIEGGKISFNDKVINDVAPGKRNIGMVFQNYAIFPHMTVKQNVAFGLSNRKVSKEEISERVEKIIGLVKIDEYKDRLPDSLSGGQQQRVALARAIVINPDVLLMDEPLSNLDAKLRVEMRNVIKEIQNSIGITTIYVTHDQEEAMAVSDRIAIMKLGKIMQIGTPQEVYQRPANIFVASFIGGTNVLECKIKTKNDKLTLIFCDSYEEQMENIVLPDYKDEGVSVKVSVRPEEFLIVQSGKGIEATIISSIFLGINTHYFAQLQTGEHVEIIQESTTDKIIEPGTKIGLMVKKKKINVFDDKGENNYIKGGNNETY